MNTTLLSLGLLALASAPALALVDPNATQKTQDLYALLQQLNDSDSAAFGNQYGLFRGNFPNGSSYTYNIGGYVASDCQNIAGVHPAVSGYDINEYALNDNSWYDQNLANSILAYEMGAIVTLSFHQGNPSTGGDAWDTAMDLTDILPGGKDHETFKAEWALAAQMIREMKTADGTPVPVILRPFHELTGGWFWWGSKTNKDEFVQLWQWLVTYLRDDEGLHNILYCYNTGSVYDLNNYFLRWPGDDYVDVMSMDIYLSDSSSSTMVTAPLKVLIQASQQKGKVAALAETGGSNNGMGGSTLADWWTAKILDPMVAEGLFDGIAYIAGWANWGSAQYHIPYPGCLQADDFAVFLRDSHIVTLDELNPDTAWSDQIDIGWMYTPHFPWIYSVDQGWLYMDGILNNNRGNWYYDLELGWIYTDAPRYYPKVFCFGQGWLYYFGLTADNQRSFYRYSDGEYYTVPMSGM